MKNLANQRADGASGLDDRAFSAKWAAGADGDGSGDRLQNRNARSDAAAVGEHGFHGFGNAMAFDLRRTVFGHEADDDSADHRHEDDPGAEMMEAGAGKVRGPAVKERKVSKQSDELVKGVGDQAGHQPDGGGEE